MVGVGCIRAHALVLAHAVFSHDDRRLGDRGRDGLVWQNSSTVDVHLVIDMHVLAQDRYVLQARLERRRRRRHRIQRQLQRRRRE